LPAKGGFHRAGGVLRLTRFNADTREADCQSEFVDGFNSIRKGGNRIDS